MLSIIVPVYNVEQYLRACIDSILAQTFTDWELILVDDGSPDRSGAICDEYAARDSRMRVVHKPNGGVNSARNAGLDRAKGNYITFVDGDDYLKPDTLERAFETIDQNRDVDMLQYPEVHVAENGVETLWNGYPAMDRIISDKHDMLVALLGSRPTIPGGLWGKLYARSVWLATRLRDDMRFCEDMVMMPAIMEKCRSIMSITAGGYCYVMHGGSVSHSRFTPRQSLDVSRFKEVMLDFAVKYGVDSSRWWNEAVLSSISAWAAFGPCEELKNRLLNLQVMKKLAGCDMNCRPVVKLARWFSPMIAARAYRAALKLQGK